MTAVESSEVRALSQDSPSPDDPGLSDSPLQALHRPKTKKAEHKYRVSHQLSGSFLVAVIRELPAQLREFLDFYLPAAATATRGCGDKGIATAAEAGSAPSPIAKSRASNLLRSL